MNFLRYFQLMYLINIINNKIYYNYFLYYNRDDHRLPSLTFIDHVRNFSDAILLLEDVRYRS